MKNFFCNNCGANEFDEKDGYRICKYCGSKYYLTAEDKKVIDSTIDLNDDVAKLRAKCKSDPHNAVRYAKRIMEIDPYDEEAKRIVNDSMKKSGGCYVATCVYGSYDCPQVWRLRRFRDDTLAQTWYGRAFIHLYYAVSPTLVRLFGNTEWFKNMWKPSLDKMVMRLQEQGVADTPYADN